jgi:hypothetical protein
MKNCVTFYACEQVSAIENSEKLPLKNFQNNYADKNQFPKASFIEKSFHKKYFR